MKVKKFTLNQNSHIINEFNASQEFVLDIIYPTPANELAINLIELQTNSNPSEVILTGLVNHTK